MPEAEGELVERVAAELKRPVPLDPALDARVMAEVLALPRRRRPWLLRPRTFSVTPLGALGRAAVLAVVLAGATFALSRLRPAPQAGVVASAVPFLLHAPGAESVSLVGDFNDWDTAATPLRPAGSGTWLVTVPLLPGRYRYGFVVDGDRWLADPAAPPAPDDDFGTPNSMLMVGTL